MKQKEQNRKGLLLILTALLLVIAITFIGTFASYITSRSVSDNASVAKFGLNIPSTINLFSDSYVNVQADTNGKKIIAPGTSGQYQFEVNGTAEVAYKVEADISIAYSEEWEGYKPLEFSIDGTEWTNFAQFRENLSDALKSNILPANSSYDNAQTIYWRWPFSVSSENDVKDTAMGALSADRTPADVTVNINVTAAQVD